MDLWGEEFERLYEKLEAEGTLGPRSDPRSQTRSDETPLLNDSSRVDAMFAWPITVNGPQNSGASV